MIPHHDRRRISSGDAVTGSRAAGLLDLFNHLRRSHSKPAFDIARTAIAKRAVEVRERTVFETPFCRLVRFARDMRRNDPAILLVAPLSGQFASLLRDTVEALLPDHEVFISDWWDARFVPASAGEFRLDDMVETIMAMIRAVDRDVHVVGLSQSAVPVLMAAALMAQAGDPVRPRTIILMGGLINTGIGETPMNRMASMFQRDGMSPWFETSLVSPVPPGFPGTGRLVHPAALQFAGLAGFLIRRLERRMPTPLDVFCHHLVGGTLPPMALRPFYDEFLTLMDVPAEVFLDTMRVLFRERASATGALRWRGQPVAPESMRDIGLMTIEAAGDQISGPGQTFAAQGLCRNIPPAHRLHHVEPGIGHLGLFHGHQWRTGIRRRIARFVRRSARDL